MSHFVIWAFILLLTPLARAPLSAQPAGASRGYGGQEEASPNERKKQALLAAHRSLRDSFDPYFGGRWIPELRRQLAELPSGAPPAAAASLRRQLAEWLLREGEIEEALELFEGLAREFAANPEGGAARGVDLFGALAVAHLRYAEDKNCACEHRGTSCVFPLGEAARHEDRKGAETAAVLLTHALELAPYDIEKAWLLNLAHMALGSYPGGVPALHRIPPRNLASSHDIGRFEDVAARVGISRRTCAGGAVMDDFDGDGDLDILTSSMETGTPMAYWRNEGDGTFTDVALEVGLGSQLGGLNFVHGDVDGDGRLDLYVMRGAWMGESGAFPHSLVRQQVDGTFVDVTAEAGLELRAPSQVAAFADVDNDGDLDLFVGCESVKGPSGWMYPSRLYANRGDGTFEDVAERAGVANFAFCKGAAFGDFDGDGFADLYVSNGGGMNRLYRNGGDGTFVDRAQALGVGAPLDSFATWWFDANNDGWLDLFVTNYGVQHRGEQVAGYYKNGTSGLDRARLYLNDGAGGFVDTGPGTGLDQPVFPMGANHGDLDNDGFSDLYFGTGDPRFSSLWPNVALRNVDGRRFQDVTTSGGFGHLQKGHGVAFGDIDGDGDQDIFVQMGGMFRDDAFWDSLYENPGHGRRWLVVRPRGTRSNRFAVGARIRVRIEEPSGERDVYTFVDTGGSFGGNSLQAEIGLGDALRIVELDIRWPATSAIERFEGVPLDRTISILEGSGAFEVVRSEPIELR